MTERPPKGLFGDVIDPPGVPLALTDPLRVCVAPMDAILLPIDAIAVLMEGVGFLPQLPMRFGGAR